MARSGHNPKRAAAVERGIDLRALGRVMPKPVAVAVLPAAEPELAAEVERPSQPEPEPKKQAPRKPKPGPGSKVFLLDALKRYGSHSSECYWQRGGDWCDCGLEDYTTQRTKKLPSTRQERADLLLRFGRHKTCGYTFGRDWCDCGFWAAVQRIDPTLDPETGRRS